MQILLYRLLLLGYAKGRGCVHSMGLFRYRIKIKTSIDRVCPKIIPAICTPHSIWNRIFIEESGMTVSFDGNFRSTLWSWNSVYC